MAKNCSAAKKANKPEILDQRVINGFGKSSSGDEVPKGPDRFIPVTKWPEYHPWPTVGGLRHLIHYSEEKGFTHCIVRKGGRVLISEQRFFEWIKKSCN